MFKSKTTPNMFPRSSRVMCRKNLIRAILKKEKKGLHMLISPPRGQATTYAKNKPTVLKTRDS
jgi:hypothetical protein